MLRQGVPWVEKYRPTDFKQIVLNDINKNIITNMLANNYIPNLLLYGPPGTGKTTTIINLIQAYQLQNNQLNRGLMIHLNASDERGIDTIRTQIHQFVQANALFAKGMKFVILDEVDYMTKNAQQALKIIVQLFKSSVRFCLICNYVGRIDDSLQSEFMRLRFNLLPEPDMINFLQTINTQEDLRMSAENLAAIQALYGSDMRSMINYMQAHLSTSGKQIVRTSQSWLNITAALFAKDQSCQDVVALLNRIGEEIQVDDTQLLTEYFNFVIEMRPDLVSPAFLSCAEFVMHSPGVNVSHLKLYMVSRLQNVWQVKLNI